MAGSSLNGSCLLDILISWIPYYVDCFEAMKLDGAAVHDHPLQELSCKNGQVTDRTIQMDTFQTAVSSNTITAFPRAPSSFPPLASHQPLHAPLSNNLQSSACPKSIWHCTCRKVLLRWCDRCGRKIAHSPKESPAVAEHLSTISRFSKRSFSNWATLGVGVSARKPQKMASLELLSCSLHNNSQGTWLADRILSPAHPKNLHDFGTFGTDNSSSPLTSPLGHSSTDPRDHTLVNHWKTKFLDPKGTIKCCLAHPRIELAFSINRLQGSKSFTFSSSEGSEGFHRSPAHTNIESASQTCGLSFCSMLTRYSRYSRGVRWLQSVTNTWKSRELEESKQIISWDDWSSIRDRHEESRYRMQKVKSTK